MLRALPAPSPGPLFSAESQPVAFLQVVEHWLNSDRQRERNSFTADFQCEAEAYHFLMFILVIGLRRASLNQQIRDLSSRLYRINAGRFHV